MALELARKNAFTKEQRKAAERRTARKPDQSRRDGRLRDRGRGGAAGSDE